MSAQAVNGTIQATISLTNTLSGTSGQAKNQVTVGASQIAVSAGTGAGQCNELWSQTIALVASTPQTLDLTALTGEGGRTVSFSAVKIFEVVNNDPTNPVTVGNAATTPFAPFWNTPANTESVPGGGCKDQSGNQVGTPMLKTNLTAAGWSTTGATKLKLDPGANAISVTVTIAGLA